MVLGRGRTTKVETRASLTPVRLPSGYGWYRIRDWRMMHVPVHRECGLVVGDFEAHKRWHERTGL